MSTVSDKADSTAANPNRALTPFEQRFIDEYLKDLNGARAWLRAGGGGHREFATQRAYECKLRPAVALALEARIAERREQTRADTDMVLRELIAIATADANEIIEIRRGCCRHCHGTEHRFQYTDERELAKARAEYDDTPESLVEPFTHGGLGFDVKLAPVHDCPKCGGDGGVYVHVKDTRDLSPAARSLFAGAKQTKDGIEVKLHSKEKAVELLARHLGMLNDKLEVKGDLGARIVAARKRVGRS